MPKTVEPEDLSAYAFLSEPSPSPDGATIALSVHRPNLEKDEYEGNLWLVPRKGGRARQITFSGKDGGPRFSPDGTKLLFTSRRDMGKDDKGNGLYALPLAGGEARLVLRRKEGIEAPRWSPDGERILFLSSVGQDDEDVRSIRRIQVWFNERGFIYGLRKHLFAIDAAGGEPKQLTTGDMDVSKAAWSHKGDRIAFLASTDELHPYLADVYVLTPASGTTRKLTRGTMEITSVGWSPDDRTLLLTGDDLPRGFASHEHLWRLDAKGGTPERLDALDRSLGNGLNCDVRMGGMNVEPKWVQGRIYFAVAEGGSVHLYGLDVRTGKVERVVGGDMSLEAFAPVDGGVVYTAMEKVRLPELYVHEGRSRVLTAFNAPAHATLDIRAPERFTFKASDGETIEGWALRPKARGKRPTILYIHGGPKTAFGYAYLHEFQTYAAKGYAVVYVNPRGSDGYSEAFADIRGHYGERDYDDLMEAVDFAAKHFSFVDPSRLAVAGGSYGGYMTNWVVTHTDRFKAAVTDRSISNWLTFWGTSDIGPYFTKDQVGVHPWEKEEQLLANSPIRYVKNVTTPLMIVHSFEDYRCWWVEALQMFRALRYLGKEAELVLFPKENHDLSRGGKPKHRIERLKAYLRWFDTHLGVAK